MNEIHEQDDRRRQAQLRRLSKFLSLLLRHTPARFPIAIDPEGFAELSHVLQILHGLPNFRWVRREDIDAVLEMPGRRRYEIVEGNIRALYGHSVVRPTYPPAQPPYYLYHGTAPENLDAIRAEGLRPMNRQFVHLSTTPQTARSIALRHTNAPAILRIDAATAYTDGLVFHHPVAEIFLSAEIPPEYIHCCEPEVSA